MTKTTIDFTMTWDCTFIVDGKTEELTVMTDDFEDVYFMYTQLKTQHKSVIFLKHELHRKGTLVLGSGMVREVQEQRPVIDADQPIRGQVQRVRNAAARGDIAEMRHDEGWMGRHNRDHAAHILREPPQDRI